MKLIDARERENKQAIRCGAEVITFYTYSEHTPCW